MGANFRSDNAAGAAPEIVAALAAAAAGPAPAYGEDPWTARVETQLAELFACPVAAFPVVTGTAANALALAAIAPPWGIVFVHPASHVNSDECGAPEFFTGGAKLVPVAGAQGKLDPDELARRLAQPPRGVHGGRRAAVSISQPTEAGTLYTPEEIRALAELARAHGLKLHMDGARFANAVAALGVGPAELTWRAGVDILSFGATKNGALAAEAVIAFDGGLAGELAYRRKRGGHLLSKQRFVAAQLEAYLADGLWLALARRANAAAARLAAGIARLPGATLLYPVEANLLFLALPEAAADALAAAGFAFYRWPDEAGRCVLRLVTSFATAPAEVDAFLAALRRRLEAP